MTSKELYDKIDNAAGNPIIPKEQRIFLTLVKDQIDSMLKMRGATPDKIWRYVQAISKVAAKRQSELN